MPAGRPTDYTPELAERICNELTDGKSLRKVCSQEGFPVKTTVLRWLRIYPEFKSQYDIAVLERSRWMVDNMLDLIDEEEDVQKARLKVDVIKWQASKENRALYGDKIEQNINGSVKVEVVSFGDDQAP